MRASDRTTAAVVLALFLAGFTLVPLTSDLRYLGASWGFLFVLGVASALLHRARLSAAAVLSVQVLIGALLSAALSLTLSWTGDPWYLHYLDLWQGGVEHMQTQGTPMDPNDGVILIFATAVAALLIITDLLATGLRRPAWTIAPLAALFLVPAIGLGTDTGVRSFLLVAIGYLAVLIADGLNTTGRWTRGLSRDSAETVGATPVVWRAATLIGVPALIGTLVLGSLLPTLSLSGLGIGNGAGGDGPLQLTDPSLDLRRNLNQPQDKEVIDYRTDAPGGLYLRLASLPQFNSSGWGNVQIRLNTGNQLPAVPGLSDTTGEQRNVTISVKDFASQYLPMPYAPRGFNAAGDWRYDANSLTVVNGANQASALRNLTYSVTSVDVTPSAAQLDKAVAGTPLDASITGAIPKDLPQDLITLTQDVVRGEDTPAGKAAAIQAYLRSGAFTYDVRPLPGNGYKALENFLLRDKRGYCEQFAASMAMMARIAGIPSRVSVGFLPGKQDGDTWRVSIREMHAWPELYFAGYGWVRFEPTPGSVTGSAPPWTVDTSNGPSTKPSEEPSVKPSEDEPSASAQATQAPVDPGTTSGDTATFPWGKTLAGSGVGLLVLLLLAAPATVRVRRRSARLAAGQLADDQVEAAWAEIRDTVLDYGGSWPSGSPHVISAEVAHRLDAEESAAMGQVATLVERSRYSRRFDDAAAAALVPQLTDEIRRGLAAPLSRRRRVLGLLVPRSLFRRGAREL
ncbi:transglutaminaseTgpA domain-containing protein [uncultured Friedmanniella sp.]|uniref:transglutaminase family protein n=1 Tax=uncultured Friedmanniella sp. TaxID=335381 RepID=UPI0035CA5741